ncbi:MAG: hypothetical protein GVY19_08005 [Bacteroidetes bacterium]|nr:hypothetical protein [Bacteroidota bacterium]
MKPVKSLSGISQWLLRLFLGILLLYKNLFIFLQFNFRDIYFYMSLFYVVFAFLLIAGGFVKRHHLTVLSSLIIMLLIVFEVFTGGGILMTNTFYLKLSMFLMAFYFLTRGSNR